MIGLFADWLNSRRGFSRWLMIAEWYLLIAIVLGVAILKLSHALRGG